MNKQYNILYNDGAFYGTMTFKEGTTQDRIEILIQEEIENNNKNINPLYHITRNNFKEVS